ncbi:hypothetical protein [Bradyrhizobium lablabi]|uniref:hypothetical protein n=1 Tax=Bradyrhizobium lablabi TaxID=722472 RepID=UPI001BA94A13|nr:hypothetical protein [Bradyrhizobium lablabi]MBR0696715.1 hypothetical protein [Bradyrhizobium lablabi]
MGQDRDILILSWLARQPEGSAYADEIPLGPTEEELASLVRRELISRVKAGGKNKYVITREGRQFQEGD